MAPAITATVVSLSKPCAKPLGWSLSGLSLGYERDHARNGALPDSLRNGHFEHTVKVHRRLEDLVSRILTDRHGLAGYVRFVQGTATADDDTVGGNARARTQHDDVLHSGDQRREFP